MSAPDSGASFRGGGVLRTPKNLWFQFFLSVNCTFD